MKHPHTCVVQDLCRIPHLVYVCGLLAVSGPPAWELPCPRYTSSTIQCSSPYQTLLVIPENPNDGQVSDNVKR